jgi:hypothetical protein
MNDSVLWKTQNNLFMQNIHPKMNFDVIYSSTKLFKNYKKHSKTMKFFGCCKKKLWLYIKTKRAVERGTEMPLQLQ